MMRTFVKQLLAKNGLMARFDHEPHFQASFTLAKNPDLHLLKTGATLRLTMGHGTGKPELAISYCLERNWFPLKITDDDGTRACGADDLWEREELVKLLRFDEELADTLEARGYLDAECRLLS